MNNIAVQTMMAVIWGIVFTYALHSMALGICMGLMMGRVSGLFEEDRNTSSGKDNKKSIDESGRGKPE